MFQLDWTGGSVWNKTKDKRGKRQEIRQNLPQLTPHTQCTVNEARKRDLDPIL